jgi:hypothetical protein
MKWLAFFLVALNGIIVVFPTATIAASSAAVAIQSISHSVGSETMEKVTFKANAQIGPKIFMMKGDNPRLVVDFPNCTYAGKGVMSLPEGKLATSIRAAVHSTPEQKTRVVIDLAKQIPVRYTSDYSEADNTLTIELSRDSLEATQKENQPTVKQEKATSQTKPAETVLAKPVEMKAATPVVPSQEPEQKETVSPITQKTAASVATKAAVAAGPQLLNVTFDDSSNKGEMVLFHLSGFHPPTVSAVEKDNPKVICDFSGVDLGKGVEENIIAKGKYVERISVAKQGKSDKIRVVLNLSPNRDYDLQQVFFKKDNLFVLIVNELSPEKKTQ